LRSAPEHHSFAVSDGGRLVASIQPLLVLGKGRAWVYPHPFGRHRIASPERLHDLRHGRMLRVLDLESSSARSPRHKQKRPPGGGLSEA
jgi:hypothetical protein